MPYQNVTSTGLSAITTFGDWVPTIIVVFVAAMLIGLIMIFYGNYSRYKRMRGLLGFLGNACIYFGKGIIGLTFFGAILDGYSNRALFRHCRTGICSLPLEKDTEIQKTV